MIKRTIRRQYRKAWTILRTKREVSIALVSLIIGSIIGPLVGHLILAQAYRIQPSVRSLLGPDSTQLASKVSFDKTLDVYQFNKDGHKTSQASGPNAEIGTDSSDSSHLYSADFNQNASRGVTVYDNVNNLSLGLTPLAKSYDVKQQINHFVYPATNGSTQLIYSLKGNGVKEDLVLTHAPSDSYSFAYDLTIPSGLEARLTDDGGVGIYSADSALFGNISYATDADRTRVETARKNSAKTHLAFYIPSPIVKEVSGKASAATAKFSLSGNTLTVLAKDLSKASYPLSIDPSIIVTSTNDFLAGDADNIDFDATNNLIKRGASTSGSTGSWGSQTNLGTARSLNAAVVVNGTIYTYGGHSASAALSSVEYATITPSTGALSSWTTAPSMTKARVSLAGAAYNGYIYAIGGSNGGSTYYSDIEYAKVTSNGTLSGNTCGTNVSWCALGTSLPNPRAGHTATILNGYLYVTGGCNVYVSAAGEIGNCLTFDASTNYGRLRQDGNFTGSWSTGTAFATARFFHAEAAYNNTIYVLGGCSQTGATGNCLTSKQDVQFTTVDPSTGAMTAWQTTTSLPAAKLLFGVVASGGYLYSFGSDSNTVTSAQIYASGQISAWVAVNTMTHSLRSYGAVAQDGRLYTIGGYIDVNVGITNNTFNVTTDAGGTNGNFNSAAVYDTSGNAREGASVFAGIGYLYLIGGRNGSTYYNTTRRAPINADGTLGTWANTSTTFTTAKAFMSIAVAPNGNVVYLFGGYGPCGVLNAVDFCATWMVGSYGSSGNITWTDAGVGTNLPTARRGAVAYYRNNIIYLAGGEDSTGALTDVIDAQLNSSGSFNSGNRCGNAWCTNNALPTARADAAGVLVNNYIYIVGGHNGGTYYTQTLYALINSNHVISTNTCGTGVSWCTTSSLNANRAAHSVVIGNGYIYAVGGCNTGSGCTTDLSTVEYAPIQANGLLGSWTVSTHSFTTARSYPGVASYFGLLYLAGGNENGTIGNDTQVATINTGGAGWLNTASSPTNSALTSARINAASVVNGNYVYIIGGCNVMSTSNGSCTTRLNNIEYAQLTLDGSMTQNLCTSGTVWCTATSLPTTLSAEKAFVYSGYLYVVGGETDTGTIADVSSIAINSNGSLASTWNAVNNPNDLITARKRFGLTTSNNYVYAVDGVDGSGAAISNLEYAQLLPNGSLGSWTQSITPANNADVTAFIANGYLNAIGGQQANSVKSAPINVSDGSVGTWITSPAGDNFPVYPTIQYVGGFLYFIGTAIQPFTILSSGGMEPVVNPGTYTLANHDGGASAYYNGYIFMFGGCTTFSSLYCSTTNATVERAAVQVPTRTSRYSQMLDLTNMSTLTRYQYQGGLGDATSSGVTAGFTLTDPTGAFDDRAMSKINLADITALTGYARYVRLITTIDDTTTAFPDTNQTSITEMGLYYHAGSPGRLQHGKTFSGDSLRSLDTEGP